MLWAGCWCPAASRTCLDGRLVAVCAGKVRKITLGAKESRTAFIKTPLEGPQEVGELGLREDRQADKRYHGGPGKALYAYPTQHYDYWSEELNRKLPWGWFGENLCVQGLPLEDELRLGDRLAFGEVEAEVTEPRIPCSKLGWRMDDPGFLKRFAESLRSGYYLRVTRPGSLQAGDPVRLLAYGEGPTVALDFQRRMNRKR